MRYISEEMVKCNRKGCRTCPHGPYLYLRWNEGDKMKKKYLGKGPPKLYDGIGGELNRSDGEKVTVEDAWRVLGIKRDFTLSHARKVMQGYAKVIGKKADARNVALEGTLKAAWKLIRDSLKSKKKSQSTA